MFRFLSCAAFLTLTSITSHSQGIDCENKISDLVKLGLSRGALVKALAANTTAKPIHSTLLLAEYGKPNGSAPGTLFKVNLVTNQLEKHPLYHSFLPEDNKSEHLTSDYGVVALDGRSFHTRFGFVGRAFEDFPSSTTVLHSGLLMCSHQRRTAQANLRQGDLSKVSVRDAVRVAVKNPCVDPRIGRILDREKPQDNKTPFVMMRYSSKQIAKVTISEAEKKRACENLSRLPSAQILPPVPEENPKKDCGAMDSDCSQVEADGAEKGTN